MKALLVVAVGNGGGLGSNVQNLFLANPCCWREPWFENCRTQIREALKETECTKKEKRRKGYTYLRKTYRNASAYGFWRLKISLQQLVWEKKKKTMKWFEKKSVKILLRSVHVENESWTLLLTKSNSSPRSFFHDVTWPPYR